MKVTNGELTIHIQNLKAMLDIDMPARAGYAFQKNLRAFEAEAAPYEQARIKCMKRYAKTDEKGELVLDESGQGQFEGDNLALFLVEVEELQKIELEVSVYTIPIDLLDRVNLTARQMFAIDFMIEDIK